jgi:hypothetical protein
MTLPKLPTLGKINKLVASLGDLDPTAEVHAQLCRSLAQRIDGIEVSKTGAQSLALPGLVKQLGSSIDALLRIKPAQDTFLDWLMAPDVDRASYLERKTTEARQAVTGAT